MITIELIDVEGRVEPVDGAGVCPPEGSECERKSTVALLTGHAHVPNKLQQHGRRVRRELWGDHQQDQHAPIDTTAH